MRSGDNNNCNYFPENELIKSANLGWHKCVFMFCLKQGA